MCTGRLVFVGLIINQNYRCRGATIKQARRMSEGRCNCLLYSRILYRSCFAAFTFKWVSERSTAQLPFNLADVGHFNVANMDHSAYQAYGHAQRIFDVRFSPSDPSVFASGSDDTTARVWQIDAASGLVRQVGKRSRDLVPIWHA